MEAVQSNRGHSARQSGRKAEKKKEVTKKRRGEPEKQGKSTHPGAFTITNARKANRMIQRNLDRAHKKEHADAPDRRNAAAPVVIAVVGPSGVGKTTLIKSLVKKYTKQNLNDTKGPITVVSSKNRRLTFLECANNLHDMTDVAKIADLVLLMIDASFGFEMETFEFLNILQLHGMPKIMGVLTHLDTFKQNKHLRNTKKLLKNRFWTEIYNGAKLFYIPGIINGKYPKTEIHNLSLYISRMKFRPLTWRNTHPYVLVDRYEDITDPAILAETPKADRTLSMYGFLRGTHLKPTMKIHLIGAGDFYMRNISAMEDPAPLPEEDEERKRRRSLKDKDVKLYAPMSNVGNVLFDKDAMYIQMRELHFSKAAGDEDEEMAGDSDDEAPRERNAEGVKLVKSLQSISGGLDSAVAESRITLFKGGPEYTSADVAMEEEDVSDSDGEDEVPGQAGLKVARPKERIAHDSSGRVRRLAIFNESSLASGEDLLGEDSLGEVEEEDEDGEMEELGSEESDSEKGVEDMDEGMDEDIDADDALGDSGLKWKTGLAAKATEMFTQGQSDFSLHDLVYGSFSAAPASGRDAEDSSDGDDDDEDTLFKVKRSTSSMQLTAKGGKVDGSVQLDADALDCSRFRPVLEDLMDWEDEEVKIGIRNRFVTGDWGEVAKAVDEAEDLDDGFEDLEGTNESTATKTASLASSKPNGIEEAEGEEDLGSMTLEEQRAYHAARKLAKKSEEAVEEGEGGEDEAGVKHVMQQRLKASKELHEYELEAMAAKERQAKINKDEFHNMSEEMRLKLTGFPSGTYVRIEISGIPCEFVEHFDPRSPVIIGGLLPTEQTMGLVRMRIKRHRWFNRTLKSNDPLIFSVGWRRYQSMPLFSTEDTNSRHRMLKYTPDHMHCYATIYGPAVPPNTGILAYQSLANNVPHFRVAATGTVLEVDSSFRVVKKLKLVGYPLKIMKNSAWIKDMFNSTVEVAKFEGAWIKTVSGIRGQIKKAVTNKAPAGTFRAAFEDKILMSDIVFCRTWVPLEPKQLYNPVTSALMDRNDTWVGMKRSRELRQENQIPLPRKADSEYKPIKRQERHFNPLKIPKKLEAALPFAAKPKLQAKKGKTSKNAKHKLPKAVIVEPAERKAYTMIQRINTMRKEKLRVRKEKDTERREKYAKKQAKVAETFAPMRKEARKRKLARQGMDDKRKRMKLEGSNKFTSSS